MNPRIAFLLLAGLSWLCSAAQPAPNGPANSAQPGGQKPAEPKPGLEGLFKGIMDQVKEKKKEPKQESKP